MIYLTMHILNEIRDQAQKEIPNEACGYLIGEGEKAHAVHKMRNADESPVHFSLDPEEQFEALRRAREMGKELIAVYHSHPVTPPRMSQEDIRLANDPGIVYLIYAVATGELKGFAVTKEKAVTEVPVELIEPERP